MTYFRVYRKKHSCHFSVLVILMSSSHIIFSEYFRVVFWFFVFEHSGIPYSSIFPPFLLFTYASSSFASGEGAINGWIGQLRNHLWHQFLSKVRENRILHGWGLYPTASEIYLKTEFTNTTAINFKCITNLTYSHFW